MPKPKIVIFIQQVAEILDRPVVQVEALICGGFKPLTSIMHIAGCTPYFYLSDVLALRDKLAADADLEGDALLTILYVCLT